MRLFLEMMSEWQCFIFHMWKELKKENWALHIVIQAWRPATIATWDGMIYFPWAPACFVSVLSSEHSLGPWSDFFTFHCFVVEAAPTLNNNCEVDSDLYNYMTAHYQLQNRIISLLPSRYQDFSGSCDIPSRTSRCCWKKQRWSLFLVKSVLYGGKNRINQRISAEM